MAEKEILEEEIQGNKLKKTKSENGVIVDLGGCTEFFEVDRLENVLGEEKKWIRSTLYPNGKNSDNGNGSKFLEGFWAKLSQELDGLVIDRGRLVEYVERTDLQKLLKGEKEEILSTMRVNAERVS